MAYHCQRHTLASISIEQEDEVEDKKLAATEGIFRLPVTKERAATADDATQTAAMYAAEAIRPAPARRTSRHVKLTVLMVPVIIAAIALTLLLKVRPAIGDGSIQAALRPAHVGAVVIGVSKARREFNGFIEVGNGSVQILSGEPRIAVIPPEQLLRYPPASRQHGTRRCSSHRCHWNTSIQTTAGGENDAKDNHYRVSHPRHVDRRRSAGV